MLRVPLLVVSFLSSSERDLFSPDPLSQGRRVGGLGKASDEGERGGIRGLELSTLLAS